MLLRGSVRTEQIQSQRYWALSKQRQGVVQFIEFQHRQNRPEDFLLHHRGIQGNTGQDGRSEEEIRRVVLATMHDLAAAQVPKQSCEMPLVDNAVVVSLCLANKYILVTDIVLLGETAWKYGAKVNNSHEFIKSIKGPEY